MTWPEAQWPGAGHTEPALVAVVEAAAGRESAGPRDMRSYVGGILSAQTHAEVIGPLRDGSGASGVVVHRGVVVGEWGDPSVIEMCFSATKTYLSVVAGVAFDRGLLGDLDEPVSASVTDDAFRSPRDRGITWRHLLSQTSQWDGTLWGKPWWCDPQGRQARDVDLGTAGSAFAYNDVRVNLLALALTKRFGRSLVDVLRTEVMEPIGASASWQWHGYVNSTIELSGVAVPVVSGGAHWGGGLWMHAYDHARLGYLYLRRGRWRDRAVLSGRWVDLSTTPTATNPDYGLLWWCNHRQRVFPSAPRSGYCARGNASRQLVWVDPARELVVVSRWTDGVDSLLVDVSRAIDAGVRSRST